MTTNEGVLVRPNIGWFFNNVQYAKSQPDWHDQNLVTHCAKYGEMGFTYITYPLGGQKRCFWNPSVDQEVPQIHLPDLQLELEYWTKHVNCLISSWIDVDSEDIWLSELSAVHFERELDYAKYLGIIFVIIELKHANSPKLAALLKKHLSSNELRPLFWILLPTNRNELKGCEGKDIWTVWRHFRTLCGNSERLNVGLTFTENLGDDFQNYAKLSRWRAEQLAVAVIDNRLFCFESGSKLLLPPRHSQLLTLLIQHRKQHISISSRSCILNAKQEKILIDTIKEIFVTNKDFGSNETHQFIEYFDELQMPLQPLSKNLDSTVYQTFEQDKTKYKYYQTAMEFAIMDLIEKGRNEITLIVLGAGRGPIVTAAINAEKMAVKVKGRNKFALNIYAVEKNPNAMLSLEYCNEFWWDNKVKLINSDMRKLSSFLNDGLLAQPDIIISELLGSFGDNELSPECLDGVNGILKKDTICIPDSYQNFVAPIQSLRLHQKLTDLSNKSEVKHKPMDSLYVVYLSQFCFLDETKKCFEFYHPNRSGESNSRYAQLKFTIEPNFELVGFSGHFQTILYNDTILSTHPSNQTKNLHSWFPAFFPLRELIYFEKKTEITFCIERKLDAQKCWYEWQIKYRDGDGKIVTTDLQNLNGESQSMKLF